MKSAPATDALGSPALLARQLLLLKEGAIVTAHLGHTKEPAMDARSAAEGLIGAAIAAEGVADRKA